MGLIILVLVFAGIWALFGGSPQKGAKTGFSIWMIMIVLGTIMLLANNGG